MALIGTPEHFTLASFAQSFAHSYTNGWVLSCPGAQRQTGMKQDLKCHHFSRPRWIKLRHNKSQSVREWNKSAASPSIHRPPALLQIITFLHSTESFLSIVEISLQPYGGRWLFDEVLWNRLRKTCFLFKNILHALFPCPRLPPSSSDAINDAFQSAGGKKAKGDVHMNFNEQIAAAEDCSIFQAAAFQRFASPREQREGKKAQAEVEWTYEVAQCDQDAWWLTQHISRCPSTKPTTSSHINTQLQQGAPGGVQEPPESPASAPKNCTTCGTASKFLYSFNLLRPFCHYWQLIILISV